MKFIQLEMENETGKKSMESRVHPLSIISDDSCFDANDSEPLQEIVIEQCIDNELVQIDNQIVKARSVMNYDKEKSTVVRQCDVLKDDIESAVNSSDEELISDYNRGKEKQSSCLKISESCESQPQVEKKSARKKYGCINVEDSVQEVRKRFRMGCECAENCFRGLNPEAVYRHRLNIAELTKEEHDMYLMGVSMACMSDPIITNKRRERLRARPNYAYSGRRVCLSAFVYLENVTLYQLKRIRKHVMTHGVTPRIHGNHGKKPHNVFPLDIYRRATYFLKGFIDKHNVSGNPKAPVILPSDVTRKAVHNAYKDYVSNINTTNEKILGYSTFRHFMKEQFPNLRFTKPEIGSLIGNTSKNILAKHLIKTSRTNDNIQDNDSETGVKQEVPMANIQVSQIPLLLTANPLNEREPRTIILAPIGHIIQTKQIPQPAISVSSDPNPSITLTNCN